MVLAALIIFSINTFLPVGSDDGLGTTAIQAKKKTYQLPNLLDQQTIALMGPDTSPNWAREQGTADSLIYGIVKLDDTALAGANEDYSHPAISNCDKEILLFSKVDKKKATVEYANRGEKLHTKTVPLPWLVKRSHRIKKQRQQVNKYASALRTE